MVESLPSIKTVLATLVAMSLCGCASMKTEPNKMGAQQDCAQNSATLSQYNDCSKQVDTFYQEYEEQKSLEEAQ